MKKIITILLSLMFILALAGCEKESSGDPPSATFEAEILEIKDDYFLVEPLEGSQELNSSDQITIPMKNISPSPEPEIGDIIEIEYNGVIAESYPAQITEVYSIKVVKEAEKYDLIPMVMVDGQLYLDTGHTSAIEARCGMIDGEITSEVDGTEKPTENNQSNFGTGYGYQYGSQDGIIEININDKWWVFATEEVLASSKPIVELEVPQAIDEFPDKEAYTATNIMTGETKALLAEDGLSLLDILESGSWNTEGTSDCISNIEITINDITYKYHSDCGTFNDKVNQRNLSLDEKTQNTVNTILGKYISLTSEEVPME